LIFQFAARVPTTDAFFIFMERRNERLYPPPLAHAFTESNKGEFSVLGKSGGLIYRTGVFNKLEFKIITEDIAKRTKHLTTEIGSSVAKKRIGIALPQSSPTVQLLQDPNNSLTLLVQKVTSDSSYVLSNILPVEVRSYEKEGACMAWHVDDILYDPRQIEVVWTLQNTSDCETRWKIDGATYRQETDPNSALILEAGVSPHCVTSLNFGKRVIIKCAYAKKGSIFLEKSWEKQQFGLQKPNKRQKKKNARLFPGLSCA
jgi:hypothetical protein